ncbi:MAG: S41 family peptidase [Anaerolineae bacterium]|nr:S41 family peptidase [Anaerolineae bacterium]
MKRFFRTAGLLICISAIFGAGYFAGTSHTVATAQDDKATQKLFAPFWQAWTDVKKFYVDLDQVTEDQMMQGAIAGMIDSLGDKHSAYMDAKLYQELSDDLNGSFEGIGANVQKDDTTGGLKIVSTIEGSPARGKLKSGDIIIKVDGQDITNLTESQIISKVRGTAGTKVKLSVLRDGESDIIEINITRAKIERPVVVAKVLENNIGYIKLNDFSANSTIELEKGLKQIDAKHLNGLIFDLRDDPGGFLRQAIEIASAFIKSGPIVIQRGRPGTQDVKLQATGDLLVPETVPMVVLINENSASASELVSGALKDYKRAIIVGVQSYGKGSVQSWMELNNGGALRLTTAHFFTPLGNAVHQIGITPDVVVEWKLADRESKPEDDPQLAKALEILSEGKSNADTATTVATATPVKP